MLLGLVLALLLALAGLYWAYNEEEPQGVAGPEAERMVQQVYAALNKPAWDSTHWVRWTFRSDHNYLWDKRRNNLKVSWPGMEVTLDLDTREGTAIQNGHLLSGEAAAKALESAYAKFCNDGFWLMAPFKLTDPGTSRSVVSLPDGRKGLKLTYIEGGVTPGDSYVWVLDEQGVPSSFRMWVSILPIGGIEASWEKWVQLPTGAKLASFHLIGGGYESVITNIDGGQGDAPGF